ncbi:MAG: sulfate adenylyltransferase [Proteobacteria bacterium]|nr:sulfate adenylyltransferase [Pseudomonadota bacterium]
MSTSTRHLPSAPNARTDSNSMRPLRLLTCGSVDDGKSTLIGRLLFDSKALLVDQIEALERSRGTRNRDGTIDLSLVTDGLEAEREQGITIDVAHRYFATARRKFIIADAPGHEQFTRNMVTAASRSDVAVLLIDVTKLDFTADELALLPQTKRHAALAHLLGLRHVVVAVNKMDAIGYDATRFRRVVAAFERLATALDIAAFTPVPVSALRGDGVVAHTENTDWYTGPALLPLLESLPLEEAKGDDGTAHLAVQWVTRDTDDEHRRWITGTLSDGAIAVGASIRVFPGGDAATVMALRTARGDASTARPGDAIALLLDRQIDVARGDWLMAEAAPATGSRHANAALAWLDDAPLVIGRRYLARHGTRTLPVRVTGIRAALDLEAGRWSNASTGAVAERNAIVQAELEFAAPLPLAPYTQSVARGAFVLVDPGTHTTAAAGMVA